MMGKKNAGSLYMEIVINLLKKKRIGIKCLAHIVERIKLDNVCKVFHMGHRIE